MAAMRIRLLAVLFALALAPSAWSQEQAFTNRATELKDGGASEARTLAKLPENTAVKVLARGGGWTRVEANGQSGWVRVFHLRFPVTVDSGSGGGIASSVTSFLGGGRQTSKSTTIATTGIRGLSPEDLKTASPDPAALAKAQSYRADKATAERFAREGKLASVSVDYVEGSRR
jgi:Bacterial SH3 domain